MYSRSTPIDVAHKLNLMSSLLGVGLIDAYCIHPQHKAIRVEFGAELPQSGMKGCRYLPLLIVDNNWRRHIRVSPAVGESIEFDLAIAEICLCENAMDGGRFVGVWQNR